MCGIAGIAYADRTTSPDGGLLARMCAALQHRGPDGSGAIVEPGIGLTMRRLSVIDAPGSDQPIFNEDHTAAVVFNGEVYNFRELRQQLSGQGHRFRTDGDTEVIVHLYEQYGLDFVHHLHGMFAVAIWDFRQHTLILARDRLGVKPLYYRITANQLSFGSEIKALLQDSSIERRVNLLAIHQLMSFGHILPPLTAFDDILELPPARLLTYKQGDIQIRRYWDLEFAKETGPNGRHDEGDFAARLEGAVARRLISDVPLGAFLSGGIDSGIVVALMSRLQGERVRTFSIGFEDRDFSELPYAAMVARHCNTDHHELIVKPNVPEIMDSLIHHHDAPFYDTSAIPTYYLSQFAAEHVTVALSGDGGDEMFAGYNIYLANRAAHFYQRLPRWFSRHCVEVLAKSIPESSRYINLGRVAREFCRGARLETLDRYTRWNTKIKRETRERLYADAALRRHLDRSDASFLSSIQPPTACSELSRLLYLATMTELPADMLRKVDRMSMAHSLEVRSPLLDHCLFEYAAQLPDAAKLKGRTTKFALRRIARKLLPHAVVDRPKRGFSVPLDRWLREDLRDYTQEILLDSRTHQRGLFQMDTVRQLMQQHHAGRVSWGRELWTLIAIEVWHRNYIDQLACSISRAEPLRRVTPSSLIPGAF